MVKNKVRINIFLKQLGAYSLFSLASWFLLVEYVFGFVWGKVYYTFLYWLNKNYYYHGWLSRDLADCESILELGCGSNSPILQIGYGYKTDAIDIWQPYIEKHTANKDYKKCWHCDILEFDFPEKEYDAVVIFDVMEHLPRDIVMQRDLFQAMESCARKKVICFTPNGFIENDLVDGDPYQEHVSAWEPRDFKSRGFKVVGGTGFRYLFGKASLPKNPKLICYILGMISQPLIYHFPKLAWHSYAVKEVE